MIPTVPVKVWEQLSIVVIFAFLLAGLGWILVRIFQTAIAQIHNHYAKIISDSNKQWQDYIDAKTKLSDMVSMQIVDELKLNTVAITTLTSNFERHDKVEMALLDAMHEKIVRRKSSARPRKRKANKKNQNR